MKNTIQFVPISYAGSFCIAIACLWTTFEHNLPKIEDHCALYWYSLVLLPLQSMLGENSAGLLGGSYGTIPRCLKSEVP